MQFWSFCNDTVNRNTASKHKKMTIYSTFKATVAEILFFISLAILQQADISVTCFFPLHPSFHQSLFNYQVCSFKGWPRRRRPWRSKPAGTLESDQMFSHPLIHTATKYVLFVMIIHVAFAQLNTTAQRLSLNDPYNSFSLYGVLCLQLSVLLQAVALHHSCNSWLCIDDGYWFQMFSG